jgi:NAD(P)H-dependent FMN reductase
MSSSPRIVAFAGSLRADSFNRKLVRIAAAGAEEAGADVTEIDLRDYPMPVYDGDLEAAEGIPEPVRRLKAMLKPADGFLIASPEYNSSISGMLKNVIDWTSRPEPDEPRLAAWSGKAAALMSASPGALGGLRGLVHVRSILGNIDVLVLPGQRAIGHAADAFDHDGALRDAKQQEAVRGLGRGLSELVARLRSSARAPS